MFTKLCYLNRFNSLVLRLPLKQSALLTKFESARFDFDEFGFTLIRGKLNPAFATSS